MESFLQQVIHVVYQCISLLPQECIDCIKQWIMSFPKLIFIMLCCRSVVSLIKERFASERTFLARVVTSDVFLAVKIIQISSVVVIFSPYRLFFLTESGILFLTIFFYSVKYSLFGFKIWFGFGIFLRIFAAWYTLLLFVGVCMHQLIETYPCLLPKLHTIMHGADMTYSFWGK